MERLKTTKDRHKLLRMPEIGAVTKIESELLRGARKYLEEKNFVEVTVPHLTRATGACENIDTLFGLDFFGETAYLSQTGQLYLESLIPLLGNVYCIGSSYRAEPSVDGRHLTEFTLIEIELPTDLEGLMNHIEGLVHSMVTTARDGASKEFEILGIDTKHLKDFPKEFHKITYTDAVKLLKDHGVKWGDDLKSNHEKFLTEHFGGPVFISHYPKAIKFFNMKENAHDPKVVNSTDLLMPGVGESVGAAEREHVFESVHRRLAESPMLRQLEKRGGSIKDFGWYLEYMKENGNVQHSGCGIGLNRVTQFVLSSDDIRTTTPYPQNRESLM